MNNIRQSNEALQNAVSEGHSMDEILPLLSDLDWAVQNEALRYSPAFTVFIAMAAGFLIGMITTAVILWLW